MRLLAFAALISLCATSSAGQSAEVLLQFDQGNVEYHQGAFKAAVTKYELALNAGMESAPLHYNLGNAFYRLDKLGQAIVHYERALLLDPANEEIRHSITLARSQTLDQFTRVPEPFWKPAIRKLRQIAPAKVWFLGGFLLYILSATLLGLRIMRRLSSDWSRRLSAVLASIGFLLILVSFVVSIYQASFIRYVFIGTESVVRTEPDELADIETRIHEGLVFDYLDREDGWVHLKLPNGATGWVVDEDLVRI